LALSSSLNGARDIARAQRRSELILATTSSGAVAPDFRALVREFTRGIEAGTSPSPSFDDGWRCQQVLDAARLSSDTGRTIPIR